MNMKEWIIAKLGILGQFLSVLFKDALQKELKLVLPIAAKIVAQIAADTSILTSEQKRNVAFENITTELLASQRDISKSIISLAIELAVQQLKNMK